MVGVSDRYRESWSEFIQRERPLNTGLIRGDPVGVSVVVIGANHRTAPLELLEGLTVRESDLAKGLHDLCGREHISEAVVLSTCNRTEVYAFAERFHGAYQDVRDFLALSSGLPPEEFVHHLYVHYDAEAVAHLFGVTAGLDSAVVGEHEIQGQVKRAWELAQAEGASSTSLNGLFRHALEVGKRVRSETGVSRNVASVSHAAVVMAEERLGGLTDKRILVLGAGEMGEGMVVALASAGVGEIVVANRSPERSEALARRVGGRAVALSELSDALVRADLLLTSTGATDLIVERAQVQDVLARRAGRELLIVDIAMPRDVDPAVAELPGVCLLDMDDLTEFAERGRRERRSEVDRGRRIVELELGRYLDDRSAREIAPLVVAFRTRAEQVRQAEFDRFAAKLSTLDPQQRAAVEGLTQGLLGKLLHEPTVRLNDAAGTPRGNRLAEALRDLFDL